MFIAGAARGLVEAGHDVTVACYANGQGTPPEGVHLVRAKPVPGAFGGSGPHPSKLLANASLARAVRAWAAVRPPDVVFAHNVEGPLVAKLAGLSAPVLWEAHTRMAEELPTFLAGTRAMGAALDHAAARCSDAAIALSDAGATWLRSLGLDTTVVPPAIDLGELRLPDRAEARARFDLDDRVWVVYAGNADPYQELPRLVEAVRRAPAVGLLLVADRAQGVDVSGLSADRLRVVASGRFADHLAALAAADIAALPRTRCAGFPMKLLNHAGAGIPTVAAGDSARPIPGTIAVDADPRAMADAFSRLAADAALREGLGEAAREAARAMTWRRRARLLMAAAVRA